MSDLAYIRPGGHLLQRSVSLAEPLLDPHPIPVWIVDIIEAVFVVRVVDEDWFVDDIVGLVGEDVEGDLGPLLLDVLDEDGYLHGAPDLSPDGGHPGLVAKQRVHGHAVLNNQSRDP